MSEIVERVARELEDRMKGQEFVSYEDAARTAIKAMREPTPAMVEAAWRTITDVCPDERMRVLLMNSRTAHSVKMLNRYRAMIDAALS